MPETAAYTFSHKEILETLIKKQNLHEGIWQLTIQFAVGTGIFPKTEPEPELFPSVVLGVAKIGIKRVEKEDSLSVDAAKVNPA